MSRLLLETVLAWSGNTNPCSLLPGLSYWEDQTNFRLNAASFLCPVLSYEQRLGCVGTVRRAWRSHRDRSLRQLWRTDCTAGCMSRPNRQPGERSRWQGKWRLNLPCVWPVQNYSQLGKFSSSVICVELKKNMRSSGRAGTLPCIRLEMNKYVSDSCLTPWYVYGALWSLSPLFPQHLLRLTARQKAEAGAYQQPLQVYVAAFVPTAGTQDWDQSHTLGLVVPCSHCQGRCVASLTLADLLWLLLRCERGIKLSKSIAELRAQLRAWQNFALRLCTVSCLHWKRRAHALQRAKPWQCFHFPCTTSAGISSLVISVQLLVAQEATNVLRYRCRKLHTAWPHPWVQSAGPSPPPAHRAGHRRCQLAVTPAYHGPVPSVSQSAA